MASDGHLHTSYRGMDFDKQKDTRQSSCTSVIYEDPFPNVRWKSPRAKPRERPKNDPPLPPANPPTASVHVHVRRKPSRVSPSMPSIDEHCDHANDVPASSGFRDSIMAYGTLNIEEGQERNPTLPTNNLTANRQALQSEQHAWQFVRQECDGSTSATREDLELQPILGPANDFTDRSWHFAPTFWHKAVLFLYLLFLVVRLTLLGNVTVAEFSCFFGEHMSYSSLCTVLTTRNDTTTANGYILSKDEPLLPGYVKITESIWLTFSLLNSFLILTVLTFHASAVRVPRLANLCKRLACTKYFWSQVILVILAITYSVYRASKKHSLPHRYNYSQHWLSAILLLLAAEKVLTFLVTCYLNYAQPFSAARSLYSLRVVKVCFYTTLVVYLLDETFTFVQTFMFTTLALLSLPNPNKEGLYHSMSKGELIFVFLLLAANTRFRYTLWDFFFTKMFYPKKNLFKQSYPDIH